MKRKGKILLTGLALLAIPAIEASKKIEETECLTFIKPTNFANGEPGPSIFSKGEKVITYSDNRDQEVVESMKTGGAYRLTLKSYIYGRIGKQIIAHSVCN